MAPSLWYLFLLGLAGLISSLLLSFSTVHSYEVDGAYDPSLSHRFQTSQREVAKQDAPHL